MSSLKIVGIAGSLRAQSYSKIVLDLLATLLPAGTQFESIDIGTLPHYSLDLEQHALPASVKSARTLAAASDAVLMVVPEYNHSLPGVFKNTLDWLSRPAFTGCMKGKPVFFITLSEGALGGVRAQSHMREALAAMLCQLPPLPEMAITHVGAKVVDGQFKDQASCDFIAKVLEQFLAQIQTAELECQS